MADGDVLNVGNLKIKAIYTPGHTNESLCYSIYQPGNGDASMVFTGDTLFAGSVGRTDLYGKTAQQTQAEKLYMSIHEKLLPLGDHMLVYPAHGAGSICGHGISGTGTYHHRIREENQPVSKTEQGRIHQKING